MAGSRRLRKVTQSDKRREDRRDGGGYDFQFVDTPLDIFLCKICHLPSKEPHLSVCCGHTFCKSCLDGIKQTKSHQGDKGRRRGFSILKVSCPMCRSEDFSTIFNKQNERSIKNLHVLCTNKEEGCDWQGEINEITSHLENSDGCQFEEVDCSNDCGQILQRQNLSSHVETECPCREVDCQYCQLSDEYQLIEGQHKEECPKLPICCPNECEAGSIPREDMEDHKLQCPLEVIECEYHSMGCHVTVMRKDQHTHEKEKMGEHLQLTKCKLMDTKEHYEAKISELESALQQSHALMNLLFGERTIELSTKALLLSSGDQVLPVIVRMSEYTKKKEDDEDWYSDPFYTHEEGYKMQLNVLPGGYDKGKETYLSVYLYLLKGPHDDKLRWPLEKKFKVTLLNQSSDTEHHSVTRSVDGGKRIICSSDSKDVWHKSQFIKTLTLQHSQYLKSDSLFFKVSMPLMSLMLVHTN